jgi:branched-chain amino acid transport system permease protein
MLYLGIMFVLTVMFLPRGLAGFLMMHRLPWHLGKTRLLIRPYVLTALPASIFLLSLIGMLEMAHSSAAEFVYLGMTFNSSGIGSWIILSTLTAASFFALRLTLPQLRAAWTAANTQSALKPSTAANGNTPLNPSLKESSN